MFFCFFFVKLRGVKEKSISWWLGVYMFQLGSLRIWNSWKELLKMWVVALLLTLLKGSKSEPPTLWEKLIPSVTSIFDTVTGKGSIPNNIFEKKQESRCFSIFLARCNDAMVEMLVNSWHTSLPHCTTLPPWPPNNFLSLRCQCLFFPSYCHLPLQIMCWMPSWRRWGNRGSWLEWIGQFRSL